MNQNNYFFHTETLKLFINLMMKGGHQIPTEREVKHWQSEEEEWALIYPSFNREQNIS